MATVDIKKTTWAGALIALGIVFGDIGTSPLYSYAGYIDRLEGGRL
ncbi:hypothetical protein BN938_1983 [Mucinivorans hirudinis]|uniref:K+ potassium transporter integral membrane domain-containing protein n=1 Tax=Mucinivorans hirudinis TaxID=1433126 RepID=A0A060R917_9BACT|nr:hypothetical protein BN938_1983 [Mucinivorans hirudinis]